MLRLIFISIVILISFRANANYYVWGVKGEVTINDLKIDSSQTLDTISSITIGENAYLSVVHNNSIIELTERQNLNAIQLNELFQNTEEFQEIDLSTVVNPNLTGSVSRCRCINSFPFDIAPLYSNNQVSSLYKKDTIELYIFKYNINWKGETDLIIEIKSLYDLPIIEKRVSMNFENSNVISLDLSLSETTENEVTLWVNTLDTYNKSSTPQAMINLKDSHLEGFIQNFTSLNKAQKMYYAIYLSQNEYAFDCIKVLDSIDNYEEIIGYRHILQQHFFNQK